MYQLHPKILITLSIIMVKVLPLRAASILEYLGIAAVGRVIASVPADEPMTQPDVVSSIAETSL